MIVRSSFSAHRSLLGVVTVCAVSALSLPGSANSVGTISTFGPPLAGTACANPEGLAMDTQGNFYTASDIDGSTTGTICVFSPAGDFTRTISIPAGPAGVAPLVGMLFEEPH